MKTYTLEEIREIVSRLAAQYGAKRVYLFGSFARGDMTESSDIDLRIDKGNIKGFQLAGLLRRALWKQCRDFSRRSDLPQRRSTLHSANR